MATEIVLGKLLGMFRTGLGFAQGRFDLGQRIADG